VDVLIAVKLLLSRRSRTDADQPSPRGDVMGPSDQPFPRGTVQFSRVITFVKDIQVWNASSDGFSFVICFASRSGPGFRGNPGFVASWRPIHQNRTAVKVIGSPFKTLPEAEKACEAVLERDDFSSNRHPALCFCWSMIPRVEPEGMLFGKPPHTLR
jgi:hypothetical protein